MIPEPKPDLEKWYANPILARILVTFVYNFFDTRTGPTQIRLFLPDYITNSYSTDDL